LCGELRVTIGGKRAVIGDISRIELQIIPRRQGAVPLPVITRIGQNIADGINLRTIGGIQRAAA